ncbi:MAG: phospho-sugar mutase, partial [Clostridia bacterium]|nr:phospho-sugar mutase [Clostridia bacterium]
QNPPKELGGMKVISVADYNAGTVTCIECGKVEPTGLPTSDVLSFTLEGGNKVLVRPSGTEPKVKIYLLMNGKTAEEAQEKLSACAESVKALV